MADVVKTAWAGLPKWAKACAVFAGAYALNEAYERLTAKSVAGEVVLITGGGSGIGRLMALKLAAMHARIIVWDVNEAGVMTTGMVLMEYEGHRASSLPYCACFVLEDFAMPDTVLSSLLRILAPAQARFTFSKYAFHK